MNTPITETVSTLKSALLHIPSLFVRTAKSKTKLECKLDPIVKTEAESGLNPLKQHLTWAWGELNLLERVITSSGAGPSSSSSKSIPPPAILTAPSSSNEMSSEFLSFMNLPTKQSNPQTNKESNPNPNSSSSSSLNYSITKTSNNFPSQTSSSISLALTSLSTSYSKAASILKAGRSDLLKEYVRVGRNVVGTSLGILQEKDAVHSMLSENRKRKRRIDSNSKSDEYDFDDPNQNYDNDHDCVISQQTHNNDAIGMVVDMSCMLSSEKFLLNGGKRRKPPPNIELLKELEVQVVRENGTENDRATNNNFVETRSVDGGDESVDVRLINLWKKTVLSNSSKNAFNELLAEGSMGGVGENGVMMSALKYKSRDELCVALDDEYSVIVKLQQQNSGKETTTTTSTSTSTSMSLSSTIMSAILDTNEINTNSSLDLVVATGKKYLLMNKIKEVNNRVLETCGKKGSVTWARGGECFAWGLEGGCIVDVGLMSEGMLKVVVSNVECCGESAVVGVEEYELIMMGVLRL